MTTREVDAWFEKYDDPMKPVVEAIRRVILEANPRREEVIKWQAPTSMFKGNLASFYPKSKQHASLMFHVGAKISGEFPSLEGTGDTTRVMKFVDLEDVERKKDELRRIVRAWIEMRS